MSSEAITRNDLTAILNEVLPPTPSEYKKLLWSNSSPTSAFSPQTISIDLSGYDEIEVHGINYTGFVSIMPTVNIPIGSKGNLIGLAGSTGDSTGIGFLVARGITANSTGITISEAKGVGTNGSSWAVNNNNMIPTKIYGIKYDYVAPPQAEVADCIVEQGTSGIWNYRKWASGIAECWGTHAQTITPTSLFIARPNVVYGCTAGGGFAISGANVSITDANMYGYALGTQSGSQTCLFDIKASGRWK